jgi:Glycosyl transferase family 11
MLVVSRHQGNHTNRLLQAVHIEAFCLENNLKYYNPSLRGMAEYYCGTRGSKFDTLICRSICRSIHILNKLNLLEVVDFNDPGELSRYYKLALSRNIVFVGGWFFRAPELTRKYRHYFISKYSLLPRYYRDNELYEKLSKMDRARNVVVGIHVRRGDYKVYQSGKYYFSDDVYRRYMYNMVKQLRRVSEKHILFIIFSDEKITIAEDESVIASRNPWYIDHFLMSGCDYLIGPPSSFTLWASYIGKAKYLHFRDGSGAVNLNDFAENAVGTDAAKSKDDH